MRIPQLVWRRKHNVAALQVSFGKRVWHTREIGDLILGYNAAGRLARVIILNPRQMLAEDTSVADAIVCVTASLLRAGGIRQNDLDVLRSALQRANVQERSSIIA
jgi:hypothetical protein